MSLQDNPCFQAVKTHADAMLAYGRGSPEDPSIPLFANVVDTMENRVRTHQMIPPPGIRLNDFSWAGNNLMHDVPFLETLLALSRLTGDSRYETAVDDVFRFYAQHCPHPETGLFGWGEHAQWSFVSRRCLANACQDPYRFVQGGFIIHDHLRFAPEWFWKRMWAASPEAVTRFAHGLNLHIMNPETFEHNRHAPLEGKHWNEIPYRGKGKDFARHAGMFIFETLFAFKHSHDHCLLEWAERKAAWHLDRRLPNGIVCGCVRTPSETMEGQHDSFACSLLDAARMLGEDSPEGTLFNAWALELFEARRHAKPRRRKPDVEQELDVTTAWNRGYGARRPGWGGGALAAQVHARAGIQAAADSIVHAADAQIEGLEAPPPDRPVIPWAFVDNLIDPVNAFSITGDGRYLDQASRVASWALERLMPTGLILGVINMEIFNNINILFSINNSFGQVCPRPGYYFSGTGAPSLARLLLRLALLQEGKEDFLGADSHQR